MKHTVADGRKRRGLANRQSILKAAEEIFLKSGYSDNTMMDISRKAGVGYGTLYTHFKGKDDILKNLMNEIAEDFNKILYRPYEPNSIHEVEQRQVQEIRHVLQLAVKHRLLLQIIYQAMGRSSTIQNYLEDLFQQYIDKAVEDYAYSCNKGLAKMHIRHEVAAKTIVYMIKEYFWDVVLDRENDIETISKNITSIYLHGAYKQSNK